MVLCILTLAYIAYHAIKLVPPARKATVSYFPTAAFPTATIIAPSAQLVRSLPGKAFDEPVHAEPAYSPETYITYASAPIALTDESPVATLTVEPGTDAVIIDAALDAVIPEPALLTTANWAEAEALWSDGDGFYLPDHIPSVNAPAPYGWDSVGASDCDLAPAATPTIAPKASKPVKTPIGKAAMKPRVKASSKPGCSRAKQTVPTLRREAKAAGIPGYSAMKKQDIIDALNALDAKKNVA